MVSRPVTFTGSEPWGREVLAPAGRVAARTARTPSSSSAETTAMQSDLGPCFRKQTPPPVAGKKVRVDFADKIHRTGRQHHFPGSGSSDDLVDCRDRIALDARRRVRRERGEQFRWIERI